MKNVEFETTWQHVEGLISNNKVSDELLQRISQTKLAYPYMRKYEMQLNNKKTAGSAELDLRITNEIRSIINKLKEITE
jgi:hypothetical protein